MSDTQPQSKPLLYITAKSIIPIFVNIFVWHTICFFIMLQEHRFFSLIMSLGPRDRDGMASSGALSSDASVAVLKLFDPNYARGLAGGIAVAAVVAVLAITVPWIWRRALDSTVWKLVKLVAADYLSAILNLSSLLIAVGLNGGSTKLLKWGLIIAAVFFAIEVLRNWRQYSSDGAVRAFHPDTAVPPTLMSSKPGPDQQQALCDEHCANNDPKQEAQ